MRPSYLALACLFLIGAATWQQQARPQIIEETASERAEVMKIPAAKPVNELALRTAFMEEVHQKILAQDFAWLDAKERDLREERTRADHGGWRLARYYDAMWYLGQAAPDCSDPADAVLENWRKASPNSPAPIIVSATRLEEKAWCFRGSGSAGKVDPAAWAPFHQYIAAAYDTLAMNKKVASVDPQYYAIMARIYVAQGRSEDEFRELLDEAVAKDPYYYGLYYEAFRYYEPQWFGSYEDEEKLAQFAIEHTRAQDRTSVFARIYWVAMDCGCLPPVETLNRPALRRAMHDLAELDPSVWTIGHMAAMACAIGDGELARSYFNALPPGDDGKVGWEQSRSFDLTKWQECRTVAGLPANPYSRPADYYLSNE